MTGAAFIVAATKGSSRQTARQYGAWGPFSIGEWLTFRVNSSA